MLSLEGLFILLKIVGSTVIFTWVYLHTRGSVLIAILFHTMSNLADYVIPVGMDGAGSIPSLILIALQWVVIGVLGRRMFYEVGVKDTYEWDEWTNLTNFFMDGKDGRSVR